MNFRPQFAAPINGWTDCCGIVGNWALCRMTYDGADARYINEKRYTGGSGLLGKPSSSTIIGFDENIIGYTSGRQLGGKMYHRLASTQRS